MATLVMVSILVSFRPLAGFGLSQAALDHLAGRLARQQGARAYRVSRCSRMTLMTRGLVITATTRNDAPQRGQWPMSMPNTRRKRCIQVIATRPRFAPPASSPPSQVGAGAATTRRRWRALGASRPW
jgi:hypothetical protein